MLACYSTKPYGVAYIANVIPAEHVHISIRFKAQLCLSAASHSCWHACRVLVSLQDVKNEQTDEDDDDG